MVYSTFLCFSTFVSSGNALKSSISLGSTYQIEGFPDEEEIELCSTVAQFIATLATLRSWDQVENWYGAQTTKDYIYYAAFGGIYPYSITWYAGHGKWDWVVNWKGFIPFIELQYWIMDDSGGHVLDKDIYQCTSLQHTRFAMIWACHQADTIGDTHWSGTPFGMPYAWLHTTDLSSDGYANPDGNGLVFIGWKDYTPGLKAKLGGKEKAGYNFLLNFYAHAFYGHSINGSLDYASKQVWGATVTFGDSMFYKGFYDPEGHFQMKVYGDGGHTLPFTG